MRQCGSGLACPRELELAGNGGWRRKGKMRGSGDGGGSGPIYRQERVEAKLMGSWGRSNRPGRARRRGGGRRRRHGAWWAACRLAKGPGARGEWRKGQLECQVAVVGAPGGPYGRGRHPPYAGGGLLRGGRG